MNNNELKHYGVLGMKWGVRRYQNKDGSLTAAGRSRYRKPDGTLTEKGKKKDEKEANKQIVKRSTKLWVEGNNYAAKRINGKWLDDFNKKWSKVFEGYDDWQDSPEYSKYEKEYFKKLSSLMNESIKNNPESKFTTKLGSTYAARYIEEHGNVMWATEKEWSEYDKKK
jgi:hypothetical protein